MGINDRINELIKTLKVTKSAFAASINVSQPFISGVCAGTKGVSDRTILDICRVYNVSEEWLRTGNGPMMAVKTRREEITELAERLNAEEPDSALLQFAAALASLDQDDWDAVKRFLEKLRR